MLANIKKKLEQKLENRKTQSHHLGFLFRESPNNLFGLKNPDLVCLYVFAGERGLIYFFLATKENK